MKSKLALLVACLLVTVFLAGCKGGGSSFGSSSGGNSIVSNLPSSGGGESIVASLPDGGSSSSSFSTPVNVVHNPEPATLGLLGSGLFAYAFLKRKKKKA